MNFFTNIVPLIFPARVRKLVKALWVPSFANVWWHVYEEPVFVLCQNNNLHYFIPQWNPLVARPVSAKPHLKFSQYNIIGTYTHRDTFNSFFRLSSIPVARLTHLMCGEVENPEFELRPLHIHVFAAINW
jgi:hypothetical protein